MPVLARLRVMRKPLKKKKPATATPPSDCSSLIWVPRSCWP
jgi:hypothetical protein